METQNKRIKERLEKYGEVDNFWAFHNYILRLGARISDLKLTGMNITGGFSDKRNKKNYVYKLKA